MTHCTFIAKHGIYILILTDKSKKNSQMEIYAFAKMGIISDTYVIRASPYGGGRSSMLGEPEKSRPSVI